MLLFFPAILLGQDTLKISTIETITIVEERGGIAKNGKNSTYDIRSSNETNIVESLEQQSTIFIKSYGLGSLATISTRGTGAGHTAMLWNGFNLQSTMNGVVDMALLSPVFIDKINVEYGGGAANWGSGAIGGTIHLNNDKNENKNLVELGLTIGSFSRYNTYLKYFKKWKNVQSGIRILGAKAKNDFYFINRTKINTPKERQQNATSQQVGFLQENYIQFKNSQLSTWLWWQANQREIPATLTEGRSIAHQKDKNWRVASEWKHWFNKDILKIRAAYLQEYIYFENRFIQADNLAKTFILESEYTHSIQENHYINVGIQNTFANAEVDDYDSIVDARKNRLAFFAGYKGLLFQKMDISFSARYTLFSEKYRPVTGAFGVHYPIHKQLGINAHISRNFRVPTFNDLFWSGQGNPHLKPELAWNQEVGGYYHFHTNLKLVVTGFNTYAKDWILWSPNHLGIWRPNNINTVWSRGIQTRLETKNLAIWQQPLYILLNYQYVLSTNEEVATNAVNSLGKQLIFVPKHTLKSIFRYAILDLFEISYNHRFFSKRYTTTDNSHALPFYHIADARLTINVKNQTVKGNIFLEIKNIWNSEYELIEWRPMPRRYFDIGFKINFYNNNINNE